MANLILPSRWTRQPQGAVEIDPVYEIFSVVNPGAALLDQRTGIFPTLTNAVPGVNSAGRTIDVAAGRVFYSEPTYAADSDAFTAILQVQVVAASSNWGVMCLRESNAKGWYLNRNYNNQNIVQFSGTGSVTTPKFVSEPVTFVIEYSGGIAAIYANGKLCGSVTKALIFIHNYAGLRLGGDASDTVSQSASLFAQTKRIGFDCESLSANPWQIFKKRPHILYFDVASGGATTSTKVTLTSSGSKAGLTGVGTYADLTQTTQF